MSTDVSMLAEIPMFSLLDHDERCTLAELMKEESFAVGKTIYTVGDYGDSLYIVRRGRVQVFVEDDLGENIVTGESEAGDVFGEISMLDGGPRTATAVTVEASDLFRLDRGCLQELVSTHPHAALDLLTVVGRRLRATDELLRMHVTRNANVEEAEQLTMGQRIADHVAAFGGSWTFIILFSVIIGVWITLNSIALLKHSFDPYPFILLNLVLSTLAAFQAPVIMMSQNRQASKDRIKSDLDFEVNRKAELEIANLHRKLDRMYDRVQERWGEQEKERKQQQKLDDHGPNDYY
jgi:CRP/FNR family transcriptional regulator, cyclic AMP receptor protein